MTGSDIKQIRVSRGLTLRQMAAELRDASHTTISRWEDAPDEPLPTWVEERLLHKLPVTMDASDFATLLELARTEGLSPEQLFSNALREYAASIRRQQQPPSALIHPTAAGSPLAPTADLTRLAAAAAAAMPHRDIKPANIHLNEDAQPPAILDFGQRTPVTYKKTRRITPKDSE